MPIWSSPKMQNGLDRDGLEQVLAELDRAFWSGDLGALSPKSAEVLLETLTTEQQARVFCVVLETLSQRDRGALDDQVSNAMLNECAAIVSDILAGC